VIYAPTVEIVCEKCGFRAGYTAWEYLTKDCITSHFRDHGWRIDKDGATFCPKHADGAKERMKQKQGASK